MATAALAGLLAVVTGCGGSGSGASEPSKASSSSGAAATPDVSKLASKKKVSCDFEGAEQLSNRPTCYEVSVPEDWSNPAPGDQVVLPVAVFSATSSKASGADPLIYLQGGPGLNALDLLPLMEGDLVEPYLTDRDVIIFDQRGTGRATPNLDCPSDLGGSAMDSNITQVDESGQASQAGPADQAVAASQGDQESQADSIAAVWTEFAIECRDQLVSDGVNLAAYNSVASSSDVEAIRTSLGYERLNLLGASYGTRLAQTYMRMYPTSLRSVTIDSVVPVEANVNQATGGAVRQGIERVLDACEQDTDCAAAYPDLGQGLVEMVQRLDTNPVTIEIRTPDGQVYPDVIDGTALIRSFLPALYEQRSFAMIPEVIGTGRDGDYTALEALITLPDPWGDALDLNEATSLSVECNEEVPFELADQAVETGDSDSAGSSGADGFLGNRFDAVQGVTGLVEQCAVWPSGTAPDVENEPVVSDIPTLVMTGSFDPVTPPSFAEQVADHLPNSFLVEFPTEGHIVTMNDCGTTIVAEFLDDPNTSPDVSCVATMPAPQWVPS